MIVMSSHRSETMHHVSSLLLLLLALLLGTTPCNGRGNQNCVPSSCGDVTISYPFRLMGDPKGCGESRYELACENNRTVLYLNSNRYYVRSITHYSMTGYVLHYGTIKLVNDDVQKDESSSLPHYTLTFSYTLGYAYFYDPSPHSVVNILNCSTPVTSPSYVNANGSCPQTARSFFPNISGTNNYYLYMVLNATASAVEDFCTIYTALWAPKVTAETENPLKSCDSIYNMMMDGLDLSYYYDSLNNSLTCFSGPQYVHGPLRACQYYYYPYSYNRIGIIDIIQMLQDAVAILVTYGIVPFNAVKFVLGAPFVLIFLIKRWRRRHLAMDANIEEFLQTNNNFLPIRYSYFDIKKITKNFKYKLGEGGYGSVYRGKLRSGSEVAVKVLKKTKANCEDFISEVATIGRIHHVNVVHLIGFCLEGSKQALVYHFLSNGSLDKHIFSKMDGTLLDCEKIYKISLGVAKGIEYLHRGCDMQILHFDIKPHNILLDDNFTPKVADFGLSRLYPKNRNTVSLTAARGTLGYMAPELFYKDIGGISYKADVYSFGMLLMEMASQRRNIDADAQHSSRIYFPLWIYDQLDKRKLMELEEVREEGRDITIKMIIVALWCIQLIPSHRPSMKRVVNMLEGSIDELQIPPKPLLYPTDPTPVVDNAMTDIELETFSSLSSFPLISASLRSDNTNGLHEASTL